MSEHLKGRPLRSPALELFEGAFLEHGYNLRTTLRPDDLLMAKHVFLGISILFFVQIPYALQDGRLTVVLPCAFFSAVTAFAAGCLYGNDA